MKNPDLKEFLKDYIRLLETEISFVEKETNEIAYWHKKRIEKVKNFLQNL